MFEIEVVSEPSLGFQDDAGLIPNAALASLARYDESLIKPALLFADKVRLVTLREDMAIFVKSRAFKNSYMPMRYISAFAYNSFHRSPRQLYVLGLTGSELAPESDALAFLEGQRTDQLQIFAVKFGEQIFHYQQAVAQVLRDQRDALASGQIAAAVDSGVLEVERWGDSDLDYQELVWVPYAEEYLPQAIEALVERLGTMQGAIMLEPNARRVLGTSNGVETHEPRSGEPFEASIATLASVLTAQLPGLTDMPIDEILGLRADLSPHLSPFRSEMLTIAEEISAAHDEKPFDLAREAERRWVRDVAPALREIEHHVRKGRYGRNLLSSLTEDRATMGSALSSVVLAVGTTYAGLAALLPAAATAAYPFVRALNETLREHDEAKRNRLYFLYQAQRVAAKRGAGGGAS